MDRLYSCIEQMELSARQLHLPGPSFARFSLLLTDNIVELMLHRMCERCFREDDLSHSPKKRKYDQITRRRILGRHFDEKLKFVLAIEYLSRDEGEIIRIAHSYRNEVYHTGIRYEPILHGLAWEYHAVACGVLAKYRPGSTTHAHNVDVSEAVLKILDTSEPWRLSYEAARARAVEKLERLRPEREGSLALVLSQYAVEKVERIQKALQFVVEENPMHMTAAEILDHIQFNHYAFDPEAKRLDDSVGNVPGGMAIQLQALRKSWRPRHKTDPTHRWMSRARKLSSETTPASGLPEVRTAPPGDGVPRRSGPQGGGQPRCLDSRLTSPGGSRRPAGAVPERYSETQKTGVVKR